MFVITADQVGSRAHADRVNDMLTTLNARPDLVLPAERTVGDELQLLTADAAAALDIILVLTRTGTWSVGCGVGGVQHPLGSSVRSSSGAAFVAARDAVERAKSTPTRFALRGATGAAGADSSDTDSEATSETHSATHAEALIDLLLVVRSRRTDEGWELTDLLAAGLTQAESASRLGITPQAASQRARATDWRVEKAAVPALISVLEAVDSVVTDQ